MIIHEWCYQRASNTGLQKDLCVGSHSPNAMVFGPYDSSFGQGQHTAQFWLMVDNNSGTEVVATVDVVTNYGSNNLAQRLIRRNEFVAANQWQVFTLEFNNPCFGAVESRVWWSGTVNMKFSQVTITATNTSALDLEWLVTDHLGTPRMVVNKTGSLVGVKRHDYLPFGEELYAGVSSRTVEHGYTGDPIRQKFTNYERDNETGLDFAHARYHASAQGRFTSVDPLMASASATNPQTFNRYTYALNSPQTHTDPTGMLPVDQAPGGWGPGRESDLRGGGGGALTSGGIEEIMDIPFETAIKEHNARVLQQARTPDRSNGVLSAEQTDRDAAFLFGDCGAVVVGASAARGGPHMNTPDGMNHTFHLFGDESGNKRSGLYLPEGFINVTWEGGKDQIVSALYEPTGQVFAQAHVAGISSQKDLNRKLESGKVNAAGSRYIGFIGTSGGDAGYYHAHSTVYRDAQGRSDIKRQLGDGWKPVRDFSGYSSMGSLINHIMRSRQ